MRKKRRQVRGEKREDSIWRSCGEDEEVKGKRNRRYREVERGKREKKRRQYLEELRRRRRGKWKEKEKL